MQFGHLVELANIPENYEGMTVRDLVDAATAAGIKPWELMDRVERLHAQSKSEA